MVTAADASRNIKVGAVDALGVILPQRVRGWGVATLNG